jgi:hypothetical protein
MRIPSPAFVGTATMTNWSRDASAYGRRELQGLNQDGAPADLGITLKASAVPRMSPRTSCHGSGLLRGSTCPPRASMATGIASLSLSTGMPLHAGTVARGMMQFEGGRRRLGATGGMRLRSGTLRPLPTTAWAGSRAERRCRPILRRILPEAARGATPRLREAQHAYVMEAYFERHRERVIKRKEEDKREGNLAAATAAERMAALRRRVEERRTAACRPAEAARTRRGEEIAADGVYLADEAPRRTCTGSPGAPTSKEDAKIHQSLGDLIRDGPAERRGHAADTVDGGGVDGAAAAEASRVAWHSLDNAVSAPP